MFLFYNVKVAIFCGMTKQNTNYFQHKTLKTKDLTFAHNGLQSLSRNTLDVVNVVSFLQPFSKALSKVGMVVIP